MADFPAEQFFELQVESGSWDAVAAKAIQVVGGEGTVFSYLMRGIDNGTSSYTTWTVMGAPDPDGDQADSSNTTPPLVGSVVPGSGIIEARWEA